MWTSEQVRQVLKSHVPYGNRGYCWCTVGKSHDIHWGPDHIINQLEAVQSTRLATHQAIAVMMPAVQYDRISTKLNTDGY